MLANGKRPWFGVLGNTPGEVLYKILVKYPGDVRNPIQKKPIHVLKPVCLAQRLAWVQTHKWFNIDIRIAAVYVRVGMVVDIVFDLPKICVATEEIQEVGGYCIQPPKAGETLVAPLVHDVKTQHRQMQSQKDCENNRYKRTGLCEHQHQVDGHRG